MPKIKHGGSHGGTNMTFSDCGSGEGEAQGHDDL